MATTGSIFEPPIPKKTIFPPKVCISFFPASRLNNFRVGPKLYKVFIKADEVNLGNTWVLYIFSMIKGTDNITVGLIFCMAGTNNLGVGTRSR